MEATVYHPFYCLLLRLRRVWVEVEDQVVQQKIVVITKAGVWVFVVLSFGVLLLVRR